MKVLFKEPIKEAVKETLVEEGITEGVKSEWSDRLNQEETTQNAAGSRETTKGGDGGTIRNIAVPAAVMLGVAVALRQLNEGQLEPEQIADKIRSTETSVDGENSESGRQQYAEDDAEEVNV